MTKSNSKNCILALTALAATLMAHEAKANCYVETYGCNTGWAQPACAVVTPGWGEMYSGHMNCGGYYQGGCDSRISYSTYGAGMRQGYRSYGNCGNMRMRRRGGCAQRINYGGFGPGMGCQSRRRGNCGGMKIRHNSGCGPRMRAPKMNRGCGPRGGRGRGRGF